jgi:hypothetical protein
MGHDMGASLFAMLSANDEAVHGFCDCFTCYHQIGTVHDWIHVRNHLVFDFETDQMSHVDYSSLLYEYGEIVDGE